jgi:hypothetical protein
LATYREALAQYHLHPESKFLDGDYTDKGATRRRHVRPTGIIYIGKEADRWEEQFFLGADEDAEVSYGADPTINADDLAAIAEGIRQIGQRRVAKAARMSLRDVSTAAREPGRLARGLLGRVRQALASIRQRSEFSTATSGATPSPPDSPAGVVRWRSRVRGHSDSVGSSRSSIPFLISIFLVKSQTIG